MESSTSSSSLLAWLSIVLATVSGSAIGPIFKYMEESNISPCLAISWRCQCMCIFLVPIILFQYHQDSIPIVSWLKIYPNTRFPYIGYIILDCLAWASNVISWVVGVKYTTTVRASLFANTHPLMLILVLWFTGQRVQLREWVGVLVIMTGICYSFQQEWQQSDVLSSNHIPSSSSTMFGDLLCLVSAFTDMLLVLIRSKATPHMATLQYTCYTSIGLTLITTLIYYEFGSLSIDRENNIGRASSPAIGIFCLEDSCVFGWMNKRWLALMLLFGLTVGVICIAGYNYAVRHLPPLVFSASALVDPLLTGIISWMFGIEGVPNYYTIVGGSIIIAGVYIISSADTDSSSSCSNGISESSHSDGEQLLSEGNAARNGDKNAQVFIVSNIFPIIENKEIELSSHLLGASEGKSESYGAIEL